MNSEEIRQKHLVLHDALGSRKDAEDKELFDRKHHQIWHDCDVELQQRKSELEAKSTLTEEERAELDELETMFPE